MTAPEQQLFPVSLNPPAHLPAGPRSWAPAVRLTSGADRSVPAGVPLVEEFKASWMRLQLISHHLPDLQPRPNWNMDKDKLL